MTRKRPHIVPRIQPDKPPLPVLPQTAEQIALQRINLAAAALRAQNRATQATTSLRRDSMPHVADGPEALVERWRNRVDGAQ